MVTMNRLTIVILSFALEAFANKLVERPNIVLFLADDLGYGDLQVYGHPTQEGGPIDDLASSGIRFTQVYSAAAFCTPSRAALLTGRQPFRTGLVGPTHVLLAPHTDGLPHDEITFAEILQSAGYRTGMVGKWHLGINRASPNDGYFLPQNHGFEDVKTIIPWTLSQVCDTSKRRRRFPKSQACFVYNNKTIVQQPINLEEISAAFLHDAQTFIHEKHKDQRPFFLYYSFLQTHTPMFNHPNFAGKSRRGVYGDQVLEMQWAVGEVLSTLDSLGLTNNTLILFTSDHGAHIETGLEGGSNAPFKGGKSNYHEGGLRVPLLASWPSVVAPRQVNHHILSLMDVLPTLAELVSQPLPSDRTIDGDSFLSLLIGEDKAKEADKNMVGIAMEKSTKSSGKLNDMNDRRSAYIDKLDQYQDNEEKDIDSVRFLPFFCDHMIMGARYGAYRLHFRTLQIASEKNILFRNPTGRPVSDYYFDGDCSNASVREPPLLYNVEHDPEERFPLDVKRHQWIIQTIQANVLRLERTWMDSRDRKLNWHNLNKKVLPCCNPPYCMCFQSVHTHSVCPRH